MLAWVQRNNASARETRFISTLFLLPSVFFEKKKKTKLDESRFWHKPFDRGNGTYEKKKDKDPSKRNGIKETICRLIEDRLMLIAREIFRAYQQCEQ